MGSHSVEAAKCAGLAPAAPQDPPALAAHMLRERQLLIGGLVLRADLQELRGEKGCMPALEGGPRVSKALSTLSFRRGPDSTSQQPLDYIVSFCFECGANGPPTCMWICGGLLSLPTQDHQHSNSVGGRPMVWSQRDLCSNLGLSTCWASEITPLTLKFLIYEMEITLHLL